MAKISALPAATLPALTDQFAINQGGVTKRVPLSQVRELGLFNVKDYGAVGNAIANDTAAVQAAIDAAIASPRRGGTVYFPGGTYNIHTTLTVPEPYGGFQQSISLVGEGAHFTTLSWLGPTAGFVPVIRYLGQNLTHCGHFKLRNAQVAGRAETVGIWLTGDANTGGTTGGSLILEQLVCENFSRGVILGDALNAVSELVFIQPIFYNCDYAVFATGFNTLDIMFHMLEVSGCTTGIFSNSAGCFQFYGGSMASNGTDFSFAAGGAVHLNGVRSETADRFLVNMAGNATIVSCVVQNPTNADKVAIVLGSESLVILGSTIAGKIQTNTGGSVSVIGSMLGNGGDAGQQMLYVVPAGSLNGVSLFAFGNLGISGLNGASQRFRNRMSWFDGSNVEHGWMHDAANNDPLGITSTGATLFQPQAAHPTAAALGTGIGLYTKGGKLVIPYSNAGTLTFLTIPLDGATATWSQTTTPP